MTLPITVTVDDGTGRSASSTLNFDIKDDTSVAQSGNNYVSLHVDPIVTNLSFIVDISSSMSDGDLADTKAAIIAAIDAYGEIGTVNVNIVQFYGNGTIKSGWIDGDAGKAIVLDNSRGGTDIEQGLREMVEGSYSGNQPSYHVFLW